MITQSKSRNAFTLVEILVSLGIIVIVTALGLPSVKEALQSKSTSRSADVVRGAFETARRMAMHRGLPCGVLIERRAPAQTISKDQRYDISNSYITDSNAANFSARMSFVQIPTHYPNSTKSSATAYPFYSLTGSPRDNCNREMKFYVKRDEAELLYAAAEGASRSLASRLIKRGTKVNIKLGSEEITQFINTLEITESGLTGDMVVHFDNPDSPASCLPEVVDPPLGANNQIRPEFQGPGVIFTTNEARLPDVSRRKLDSLELAGSIYKPVQISIELDPIPMAMAPISLPGRNVIDLSVSGSRANPLLFNAQELLSTLPPKTVQELATPNSGQRAEVFFHSVVVMFGKHGEVDSIFVNRWDPAAGMFQWVRATPPPTLAFLVGPNDGIPENIDDLANYPSSLGSEGGVYEPTYSPNFVNSDCHWVHLHSQTGVAHVTTSASQPSDSFLQSYFGWTDKDKPSNRQLAKWRIEQSRRLVYGGAR